MKGIFEYAAGDSVIHRLNPVSKICLAFCICVAAFLSGNIIFLFILLLLSLLIGAIGHVFKRAPDCVRTCQIDIFVVLRCDLYATGCFGPFYNNKY